jgi:hypothetical protein
LLQASLQRWPKNSAFSLKLAYFGYKLNTGQMGASFSEASMMSRITLLPLLCAVCFVPFTSTARAEMLLAELTYTAPQPVIAPASFNVGVGNSFATPPTFHNWTETVPTIPYMSTANMTTVAEFDRLLTTRVQENRVAFGLANGPYAPPRPIGATFSLHRAFAGDYTDLGLSATLHAPTIGSTYPLQWYALTAIERSVTPTIQTIRIYGIPAPEPTTWLIAVFGGLLHVNMCRSCSARGHRRHMYHKR